MALHLPPAVSVSRFVGGYSGASDYTDLSETQTNDSLNVLYGPNGDLDKRPGSYRLLNVRLANASSTATGEPITGHYWFAKLGSTSTYHVVGAGDSVYQYTSSTASPIATSLQDDSNTFFTFVQTQDPRTPGDDIVLITNGVNAIRVWNGTGTAVLLSSFTSASSVPIAKYILVHKEQVYAANITDTSDVDAPVKVMRSGFGTDGAADPHIFTAGRGGAASFYAGGSSRSGDIRGMKLLNDQIFIYTRKSVWRFNPGSGGVTDLQELQGSIGLFAPFSLVNTGNFHLFLSEQGVIAFDGVNFAHLSEKVDKDLFTDSKLSQLQYAKAEFDKRNNQYKLYYPFGSSNRNNRCLIYDLRIKSWQPPVTGRNVSYISTFDDSDGLDRVIYGDYHGYLFEDGKGTNDGIASGYNGTVSAATTTTITDNRTGDFFTTAGDGLLGLRCRIIDGLGAGQERVITGNTSAVLTLENTWDQVPDTTSKYTIGGVNAYWRSKDYDFGAQDILKLFRHVLLRVREEGNVNLTVHYIVDFNDVAQATSKDLLLLDDGLAWGVGRWDQARWGAKPTIRRKISLRNTTAQSTNGTHLALRFSNQRANESFRVSGFDMEIKATGKR